MRPTFPALPKSRRMGALAAATVVAAQLTACAAMQRRPNPDPPKQPVLAPVMVDEAPLALPAMATCLSPNFNSRRGIGISAIVLHHTASAAGAMAIARYFQSPRAMVSAHYIVDRDGTIVRCVPDEQRAWHAGPSQFGGTANVNDFSLGIEICNKGDNIEPYPPAQVAAVTRLVAQLADRYRISLDRVTRHRDVALPHGIKIDPSDNFDFDGVVASARHLLFDHSIWLAKRDRNAAWPANSSRSAGSAKGG